MKEPWSYVVLKITPLGWEKLGRVTNHNHIQAEKDAHALGHQLCPGRTQHVIMNANAFDAIVGREAHINV